MGGLVSGLLGGAISGAFALKVARDQRDFIKKQRETAYQTTMEDMRKAGLNPILAYRQGPTTGGQATQAQTPDFAGGMAAGSQAASAKGLRKVQQGVATSQTDKFNAEAALARNNAMGVNFENVGKAELAKFYQTEVGKTALHGKAIGGIWGPPAAAAAKGLGGLYRDLGRTPPMQGMPPFGEATNAWYERMKAKYLPKRNPKFQGRR